MAKRNALVIVANRLPVDQITAEDGTQSWQRSPGGLVTALEPVVAKHGGTWVGWAGSTGMAPAPFTLDNLSLHPVPLTAQDITEYYEGFSNGTLWPLYHDAAATPKYHRRWWDRYVEVNHRFAQAAADVAAEGAVVWVQDYQLQLVPAILRKRRPDLRIGFFLHIPFPPVELFSQLPSRTQLLEGLLGADLLGFQHPDGAHNFLRLANYLCGYETDRTGVIVDDRRVRAEAFPISIDFAQIDKLAQDPNVLARAAQIREELGNPRQVILGVDRLDYIKGIEKRLKAFRELLDDGDISVGDTVLVQVATPSRERVEHYQELREEIEREVGRINGEFSELGTPAVHYLRQSYDIAELAALYRAADVMLVTPLRDGMNLVAKEYVSARPDLGGTLVLSEFTGASSELTGAFLVNPYDIDGMKRIIIQALRTDPTEGKARMSAMRERVAHHDVTMWAAEFLTALHEQTRPPEPLPGPLVPLASAQDVWVVCDYDGTLSPFVDDPTRALPAPGAYSALMELASLPHTQVALATGRPAAVVRGLLGLTPDDPVSVLGMHGFEIDASLGEPLSLTDEQQKLREQVRAHTITTLEDLGVPFVQRPLEEKDGAVVYVEDKPNSVAVHVRRLDPAQRENVLMAISNGPALHEGLAVTPGDMVLEMAVTQVSKGDAMNLLRKNAPDAHFLVLGDDVTDIDAFATLQSEDVAVIVDRRLPDMLTAARRGTLRPAVAERLTPLAIAHLSAAVTVPDPAAAVALLKRFASARAQELEK
ncbi:MAG: bifunctional alpha,alpha-trehalose-phosphate synthase (UDP-forming)/trehalose-phosphatase [Corynebacteriales bacterium]|nr:bifunctional alpha,alpha-trehalose-phosphate synthase (UDP-forming)/trehalose-phosphatase [Mycobacteriales bacterium]